MILWKQAPLSSSPVIKNKKIELTAGIWLDASSKSRTALRRETRKTGRRNPHRRNETRRERPLWRWCMWVGFASFWWMVRTKHTGCSSRIMLAIITVQKSFSEKNKNTDQMGFNPIISCYINQGSSVPVGITVNILQMKKYITDKCGPITSHFSREENQ